LRIVGISAAASSGTGRKTAAVLNLAAALAELGRDVLVLDENPEPRGITAALGLKAHFDLEDAIRRRRDLDEVILRGPGRIRILPFGRGARSLARLPAEEQHWLVERCARLSFPVDTLLIDGAERDRLWSGPASQELVVLPGASAGEITAAYALIKRMNADYAKREFQIVITHVAGEREARLIFGNLARVAQRYLKVALELVGHVPRDDKSEHALRLQLPVVNAFPAAASAKRWRLIAQSLAGSPLAEEEALGLDDFMRRVIDRGRLRAAEASI